MTIFQACNCTIDHLSRVERRGWMRLFPDRGLYQCANCQKLQLLPEAAVNKAKAEYAARKAAPGRRAPARPT